MSILSSFRVSPQNLEGQNPSQPKAFPVQNPSHPPSPFAGARGAWVETKAEPQGAETKAEPQGAETKAEPRGAATKAEPRAVEAKAEPPAEFLPKTLIEGAYLLS